nr:GGDEF domain-containing protein [Alteromonas sp. C1M14]
MQTLFAKLLTQVYVDALTGTKNRHYFYKEAPARLAHCRRHKQAFSLVACDIDHFKYVNDSYGHPAGDEVLKQFAHELEVNLREGDILIRMGGEEFLALLPDCDLMHANTLANRLCQAVRDAQIKVNDITIHLTASFGVASIEDGDSIFDGIRKADEALYRAKASGRDQVKRVQA